MSFILRNCAAIVALSALTGAQSPGKELQSALQPYSSLSTFRSLLDAAPNSLDAVVSDRTNITVLIPTDDAIADYLNKTGITDLTKITSNELQNFLSYHTLTASLQGSDFSDRGETVPTLLKDEKFNNRTAGEFLQQAFGKDATGQVLFATKEGDSVSKRKRQDAGAKVQLRAGLAEDAEMTAVDGAWGPNNGSTFQIVNKVLLPPRNCSTTVRTIGDDRLDGLDVALKKAKLWHAIDTSFNVTCLAPSTQAFKEAGNPEDSLSQDELAQTLLAHTLDQVTYSNYLEDGMVLGTLNKTTVKVSIKGSDVYFNNAKVIKANVLTNNGLIHILDSVIQPEGSPSPTATSGSTATSATPSASVSKTTSGASTFAVSYFGLVVMVFGLL